MMLVCWSDAAPTTPTPVFGLVRRCIAKWSYCRWRVFRNYKSSKYALTIAPKFFKEREKEFGSLQIGKVADLLIVEGNPAKNISDSRNIKYVFSRGKQVDRETLKLKQ